MPWPAGPLHPAQRRALAEDLVRLRRSDEPRRSSAPQRAAKVDPNPHQIEAVVFALARLREGGCILADEVGLGKTIEAGLVIAQLRAEGARRVLLISPKSLLGQWRQELFQLFGLETKEGSAKPGAFDGDGVFLVNREAAGSEKGARALKDSPPFDLCVIDEAHEVFAGVYKRFTPAGDEDPESKEARTAGRVRDALGRTPMLLLTATPIQNNLAELWGLVQYVDPLGTLLGDLPTFREVFCGADDRQVAPGQESELRARLEQVLQRTLRRQAQRFLERPFVNREARLFEYAMSADEKSLYDDVTGYLLEPGIAAFRGRHRQLLLIGFHRRMASSMRALQASLQTVASRLEGMDRETVSTSLDVNGGPRSPRAESRGEVSSLLEDLEDEDTESVSTPLDANGAGLPVTASPEEVANELQRVRGFIARAAKLGGDDSKFLALRRALTFVSQRARQGQGSDRLVIFTESLVTQAWLRERLVASGVVADEEVTLLSGTNDGPRALQALERWKKDVRHDGEPPSTEVAIRLALVHEFKTRSRVFISTEAGAKGLNLQFCNTVVNYDLPWNPQRIEQRIGRCHRYGQQHDVTVINFLAADNETQRLTFDILSAKLELFGTVLDASDQVLHQAGSTSGDVLVSAIGAEFEGELRRIYERARTVDEVHAELRALRDRVDEERRRFEETNARTAAVLAERFDDEVQQVFRRRQAELPAALAELDADLSRLVTSHLEAKGVACTAKTEAAGVLVEFDGVLHGPLHLAHPLVVEAVQAARSATWGEPLCVKAEGVKPGRARLRMVKVSVDGFERVEALLPVAVGEDGDVLDGWRLIMSASSTPLGQNGAGLPERSRGDFATLLDDATEQALFLAQAGLDAAEHQRFERAAIQGERFVEDRLLVLRKRRAVVAQRFDAASDQRDAAIGAEARAAAERRLEELQRNLDTLDVELDRVSRREDARYRQHQAHIQQRRYTPPRLETLFELDLVIP